MLNYEINQLLLVQSKTTQVLVAGDDIKAMNGNRLFVRDLESGEVTNVYEHSVLASDDFGTKVTQELIGSYREIYRNRDQNLITLKRRASAMEAHATIRHMVAGGMLRMLKTGLPPSRLALMKQVANNESFGTGIKARTFGNKTTPKTEPPKQDTMKPKVVAEPLGLREFVEFGEHFHTQFDGVNLVVRVNASYVLDGSKAPGENGRVVQVGTPLAEAWIAPSISSKNVQ